MKLLQVFTAVVLITAVSLPAYAAKGGTRGPGAEAREHASEKSIFNRISDWFSGQGKPSEAGKGMQEHRPEMEPGTGTEERMEQQKIRGKEMMERGGAGMGAVDDPAGRAVKGR